MPQYEPKTDSKEFELLSAGQDATPAAGAAQDSADITIRLWYPDRPSAAGVVTWKTESVLVYMIADLVAASRGRQDESPSAMMAHFDNTGQALVAAKRVQTSILEFLTCRPSDSFAAAVLIHQPSTRPGGFTPGIAQGALRLAEPGQILLSAETARLLQDVPGIQLRSVPGLTTGGDEHAGLTELVWTSPERMARFRTPVSGAAHRDETSSIGATTIVNGAVRSPATGKVPRSVVGATGEVRQSNAATAKAENVNSGSPPVSDLRLRDSSFEDGLDEGDQASFLTRTRLMIGLAAVVVVSILVWAFYPTHSKVPVRVPENQAAGTETPKPPIPDSTPSQPTTQPPLTEPPAKPPVVAAQPSVPTKPPGQRRGKEKTPLPSTPVSPAEEQQPIIQGFEGMTQKDIPNLLQMARKDAGGGNYEKARREYRVVLQIQPSNAEAREGLRRLDIAQSDR